MNKLLTKVARLALGLSLAAGVGVAIGSKAAERADAAAGDTYEKVTDASNIADGDLIIFVKQDGAYACSTTQNSNNRGLAAISLTNNKYTKTASDNVQEFTVVAGSTSGQFGFHTGTGYIYSGGSSSNYLKTNSTASSTKPSGTSAWTISISSGVASVMNASNTSYYLAFNGTTIFSQYKTGQSKTTIYKKAASTKTATQTTITAANSKTTLDASVSPADSVQLSATVTYNSGANTISSPSITWSGDNDSVATISNSGLVTAVGVGTATFTAVYAGDNTYAASSNTILIRVTDPNVAVFNFADLATANSWVNEGAYSPIVVNDVTITAAGGGNNAKYYTSNHTWRMYSGGSLTITAPSGKYISSISSTPVYSFNIDSGATFATASFTAKVEFTVITVVLTNSAPQILYTVSYNANLVDYTGAVPSATTQSSQGAAITVASALSCDGFTFNGWNTQADGEGTDVTPGATNYVPTSNHTLYGKWTENQGTGDTYIFDFTSNPGGWPTDNSATLTDYTYTLSGDDFTFSLSNVKSNSGYVMCTAPAVLGLPALSGYKLTKVVAYNSSGCSTATKVGVSSASDDEVYISGGAIQTWSTVSSAYTYNLSDTEENTQYYLYVTNKNAQITSLKLTYEEAEAKTIASSRMVTGTVSASNESNEWHLEGFKFFVTYTGESETEVTNKATFTVDPSTVPTITASGTTPVTVTGEFKTESITSSTIQATLTYVNLYSVERLYTLGADLGQSETYGAVEFDGVYMGYITHVSNSTTYYDLFVGNGNYGIEVYGCSSNPSSYTAGSTKLTVTGTLCTYNYLYEVKNATVNVASDPDRIAAIDAPTTYVVTGSESGSTLNIANRRTSLSGTVAGIKVGNNARVDTNGTTASIGSNNTVYVSVGGNEVILYIKSAQLDATIASKIIVGQPITAEGFSTYFVSNNQPVFEVLFEELVEADENYHAADFAKDLLKQTRAICAANDEGNGSALTSVWTTLAGSNYWLKIEAAGEASTLVGGTPDSSIVVPNTDAGIDEMTDANAIAAALYRYDWCTAKYNLTNFMNRSLTVSFGSNLLLGTFSNNNTNTIAIIVIISMVSVTAIGGYFFIKRRKVN